MGERLDRTQEVGGSSPPSSNTVYLSGLDGDSVGWLQGGLWPVAVFGAFDVPAGHLAFDAARVGAETALGERFSEDLADCLLMCRSEAVGGKIPGASGCCGGRPAGRG